MREWVVRWEIELTAGSPREAAEQARRIQRDPSAWAGAYTVVDADTGAVTDIDLDQED